MPIYVSMKYQHRIISIHQLFRINCKNTNIYICFHKVGTDFMKQGLFLQRISIYRNKTVAHRNLHLGWTLSLYTYVSTYVTTARE